MTDKTDKINNDDDTAVTVVATDQLRNMLKDAKLEDIQEMVQNGSSLSDADPAGSFWREGRIIGKYVIVKRIGKGGMGEIYLARHSMLGTYRALKVLPAGLRKENSKFYDRFIREAKLASEIRHPNVVSVMDIETDSVFGFSYIVMEYIDGGSLRNILKSNKQLSEEQAVVIVEAIASALRVAEEHDIVHRDIKPDNIMFTKQGEIKLADLGIAKNDKEDNNLTNTNVMIGTPAYLPPEQVQDARNVDGRADIYSLGATFYEMLTGQHPYAGQSTYEILHRLFSDPVPDPRKINPDISAASASIVMKMLAKDADDRFQNAGELLDQMDQVFPSHTANETAELIKKLIAGISENSSSFISGISSTRFARRNRVRKIFKWAGLISFSIAVCLAAGFFVFNKMWNEFWLNNRRPVKLHPLPLRQEMYRLQIKTTSNSEIHFISPDGVVRVLSADQRGILDILDLPAGSYKIKISCRHYRSVSKEIDLKSNMSLELPLAADRKKLVVNALPGSVIHIYGIENPEKNMTVSPSGTAVFTDLLEENLQIRVDLPGWETYQQSLMLNKDIVLNIQQKRMLASLTVHTAPFAVVKLKRNGKIIYSATANSMGVSVIDGASTGDYFLTVSCKGFYDREIPCKLDKNRNVDLELKKITYDLKITALADTRIMLLYENQLRGTYFVPADGILKLADLPPGKYVVSAGKDGFLPRQISFALDRNLNLECRLARVPAVPPDTGKKTLVQKATPAASAHLPEKGKVKVYLSSSAELLAYVRQNGIEIRIGTQSWKNVRNFPWHQDLPVGKKSIMIRSSGIQPLPPQSFHIHPDREIEVLFEIIPVPASVIFKSNQAQAVVHFNGRSYKPGDTIFVEPFREIKLSAICGRDHLVRSINKLQPGEKVSVDFSFLKKKHPKHDLFLKGMDLFSKQKYKDALKFLEDAAKSDHMEAALKTAEIYERGLGMWFSDSGKAMKWYHKAAELGDVPSALKIAEAVENGDYDAPASQMLKYYSYAVPLKNAAVIYKISTFYKNGFRDIPQNDAKSLHYLIMAAELGLPEAMFELGIRYERGQGVAMSMHTALMWINKAAAAGFEPAMRYKKQLTQ